MGTCEPVACWSIGGVWGEGCAVGVGQVDPTVCVFLRSAAARVCVCARWVVVGCDKGAEGPGLSWVGRWLASAGDLPILLLVISMCICSPCCGWLRLAGGLCAIAYLARWTTTSSHWLYARVTRDGRVLCSPDTFHLRSVMRLCSGVAELGR